MKKYNPELPTLIFDLDGTIVDNFRDNLEIFYKQNSKKIDEFGGLDKLYDFVQGHNLRDAFDEFKISIIEFLYRRIKLKKLVVASADSSKLFDGIDSFFREESFNYNLFILTSNFDGYLSKILDRFGLRDFFIEAISDKSLFSKAKKINKIVKKYKIDKDRCTYVGDEVRDFLACQDAGIGCVSMSYGYNSRELIEKYNSRICDSVDELREEVGCLLIEE